MDLQDLSLNEAAKVCGVSPSTIRRNREELRALGAICEPSGWHVTLDQLIGAGLTTKVRATPTEGLPATPTKSAQVEALEAHIATLEVALARERVRADLAEQRFDRLLEGASGVASGQVSETPQAVPLEANEQVEDDSEDNPAPSIAPVEDAPRRSWWARLWGA